MTWPTFPRQSPITYPEATAFKENFTTLPRSDHFTTHRPEDGTQEAIFNIARTLLTPVSIALELLAYVIEPLPGRDKDSCCLWGIAIRITSFALFLIVLPVAVVAFIFGLPLYLYGHTTRPYISVIDTSSRVPLAPARDILDVRSYNLGFVPNFLSIIGDLRPVAERAEEIAQAFLQEEDSPDVISFQEGFNREGVEILCNRLKEKYPFIIHSVAPNGASLSSGTIIASKHRIEEVTFRILPHMIGPERLSPRGLFGIRVDLGRGRYANIYNTHLQALLGQERAEARQLQIREIIRAIDEDHRADAERGDPRRKVGDFLMGDFNLTPITAWGEENLPERPGVEFLSRHFYDSLTERPQQGPTGTWYYGPFANRGILMRLKLWFEDWWNGFRSGNQVVTLENPVLWGTPEWNSGPRTANTSRLDYQLVRRRDNAPTPHGTCTIEQIPTLSQSAPSDHLPIRAVWAI